MQPVLRSSPLVRLSAAPLQVLNKEELSQQDRVGHISDLNKRLQACNHARHPHIIFSHRFVIFMNHLSTTG